MDYIDIEKSVDEARIIYLFSRLCPRHMEVPRLGVEWKLQLPALHHSLSHARAKSCPRPRLQLAATPDPYPTGRGQGSNPHPQGQYILNTMSHHGNSLKPTSIHKNNVNKKYMLTKKFSVCLLRRNSIITKTWAFCFFWWPLLSPSLLPAPGTTHCLHFLCTQGPPWPYPIWLPLPVFTWADTLAMIFFGINPKSGETSSTEALFPCWSPPTAPHRHTLFLMMDPSQSLGPWFCALYPRPLQRKTPPPQPATFREATAPVLLTLTFTAPSNLTLGLWALVITLHLDVCSCHH